MLPWDEPSVSFDEKECVTYIEGLGFVPAPNGRPLPSQVRIMSNLICLPLLLYFLFQHLLTGPMTLLASFLNAGVTFNRYTGLITYTVNGKILIQLFSNAISLLLLLFIFLCFYRRAISFSGVMKRPHKGINPIAFPILLAVSILSIAMGGLVAELNGLIGLVFDTLPSPVTDLSAGTLGVLATSLFYALLEELLYHGAILTPLRRFGDGFAILAASLTYAAMSNGPVEAVCKFLSSLCVSYFVIRSGSIRIAIYVRLATELLLFGLRCINGMLPEPLSYGIIAIICALVLLCAVIAYIRFIRLDSNAFRLHATPDRIHNHVKVAYYCSGLGFILLIAFLVFRAFATIQMIGW